MGDNSETNTTTLVTRHNIRKARMTRIDGRTGNWVASFLSLYTTDNLDMSLIPIDN
jgi:hypothetical protein